MERKIKKGITPLGIVSLVFTIIGGIYTILGPILMFFPEDNEDRTAGMVFAILGGVILLIALILFCCILVKRKKQQNIFDSGKYILGEIVDIFPNYDVRINYRNPYVILIRYTDRNNNIHIFRSENQTKYPDRSIISKQVKIYYEDESFKRYYVDLEGVLPKVIEH